MKSRQETGGIFFYGGFAMAEKREQQMYEITKKLEEGVKELFTSERYTEYLKTMSKFYNYSFNNTVLIALQRPEATLVAGYSAWQKNFHRQVKKGEKGIQIIAPSQRKEKELVEKFDPETNELILGPGWAARNRSSRACCV